MPPQLARLIGVYDADGSILGELSYFVQARLGRAHCDLCDITHGRVRERADWRAARDRLEVPFAAFHRNDQPDSVRTAVGGAAPVVVAELSDGAVVPLLGRDSLARCEGSPDRLVDAVRAALEEHDLR